MFSVLIVDDEVRVAKLLRYLIDWEGMGLHIIDVVYDVKSAIEVIEKQQPDILITDIEMPVLNGIQLIDLVHKLSDQTRCIIISGYSKFEYARDALQLGVVDYLNKPIKEEELIAALEKIIAEKGEDEKSKEYILKLENDLHSLQKEKRAAFLKNIVMGIKSNRSDDDRNEALDLELNFSNYFLMIIKLDGIYQNDTNMQTDYYCMNKICSRFDSTDFSDMGNVVYLNQNHQFTALINVSDEQCESLYNKLYHLIYDIRNMDKQNHIHITIGMSKANSCEKVDFHQLYLEAKEAVEQRIYDGVDKIISYKKVQHQKKLEKLLEKAYDKIYIALKGETIENIELIIEELKKQIELNRPVDGHSIYTFAEKMCDFLISTSVRMGMDEKVLNELQINFLNRLDNSSTEQMIFDVVVHLYREIFALIHQSDKRDIQIIQLAKKYIKQNYAKWC